MKYFKILLVMVMTMLSVQAYADSRKTVSFTVSPKMSCANCERKIKSNLRFEKGVKSISTSVPEQKVDIEFNPDKTSEDKIVKAFSKIGYKATVIKAEKSTPEAKAAGN